MPQWYDDLQAENHRLPSSMGAYEYRLRIEAEAENMQGNPAPLMRLNLCTDDVRRAKEKCRG